MTSRFRAPTADGGLLADPPFERVGDQLATNADRLNNSHVRIAGIPLSDYRRLAMEEVTTAARQYLAEGEEPAPPAASRLLVAGHQPDFFHPGVWVKKFALHGLAVRHGCAPLNIVVDNDLVKSAAIRVPIPARDPGDVAAISVPFDQPSGERPHEEYRVVDRRLFDSFPNRLAAYTRSWGFEPLAGQIWPAMSRELDRGVTLATAASRARRSLERRWGVTNLELPVSRLSRTRSFAGFLFTVLSDLPRFVECYNAAIRAYRTTNGVRSHNHPAPELIRRGEELESPFWVWQADTARRERLFVRPGQQIQLMAGSLELCELPRSESSFMQAWQGCLQGDWKIRPRALTFTLFVRLCLADGFIHGIGGGKYDEVTDEIIRQYFGIEPPGYSVVSATLRLPLPRIPATVDQLHAAERLIRDLQWNPQRFPEVPVKFPEWTSEKSRLIQEAPPRRTERRGWFRKLQRATRELRPAVAGRLTLAEQDLTRLRSELAANSILASREYAWPLFPEAMLRDYFKAFV